MTQGGQFELTDFLCTQIHSKTVMDLTAFINSQGKAQYTQIGEVIRRTYEQEKDKDTDELIGRMTNAVSIYVLDRSQAYMQYLREQSK